MLRLKETFVTKNRTNFLTETDVIFVFDGSCRRLNLCDFNLFITVFKELFRHKRAILL